MQEDIKFKKLEYQKPGRMNLGKSQVQNFLCSRKEKGEHRDGVDLSSTAK